jgi:hypothetical protein
MPNSIIVAKHEPSSPALLPREKGAGKFKVLLPREKGAGKFKVPLPRERDLG